MEKIKPVDIREGDDDNAGVETLPIDDLTTTATDGKAKGRKDASRPPPGISTSVQAMTDKALHFLSHASNETLGACLIGLGASTYFVFGRVGLLLIGVAGGVVLQATWEGVRHDNRDNETKQAERERRREAGVEVARRVLEWRSTRPSGNDNGDDDVRVSAAEAQLHYAAFEPKTAQALTSFTEYFIKDYVLYWYGWSLPGEDSFPASCRRTFTAFVLSLANHLQRKRPADAFLDFTTNASSILIVFLNELAAALAASPHAQPADAVEKYLEFKPDSSLSYLLSQDAQDSKLKDAAEDILQAYLDPKAYNFPTAHVFCQQVLAKLILGYTVTTCSKPEWINEWIVYLLEESTTTKEVMDIVDAGVKGKDGPIEQQNIEEDDAERRRKIGKGEEVMDEAMREAKRLTQMMIEEDERRAREESQGEQPTHVVSSGNLSEISQTQGLPTPTSSQSDREAEESDNGTGWTTQDSPPDQHSVATSTTESENKQAITNGSDEQFLSFDQLAPPPPPAVLSPDWSSSNPVPTPAASAPLTLLNATISIFDDSMPGEKASIKAKPQTDYLIQIEPSSAGYAGWMIARKYADFESLHEVLRRISVITGVTGFAETHAVFPTWKQNTKASLRRDLERYLTDAVKYQPLAESEGMKRFLEKDQGLAKSPGGRGSGGGLGWKLGDDMINVLSKAPKQVAGGGKAVLGGVAGGGMAVLGGVAGLVGATGATGVGAKKTSTSNLNRTSTGSTLDASKIPPSIAAANDYAIWKESARGSQDSVVSPVPKSSLESPVGNGSISSADIHARSLPPLPKSSLELQTTDVAALKSSIASPSKESLGDLSNLPPPPSEMPADYNTPSKPATRASTDVSRHSASKSTTALSEDSVPTPPPKPPRPVSSQPKTEVKRKPPLSTSETSVAIELMFAVITELYTLSSAWNFRRTLLAAAKTFLLRPGSQLQAIRDLLQTSLLDANLSDEGMAAHIHKLRENALPTAEELEQWKIDYPEKSDKEKEELRIKARRLLVTKGMPAALQSVMGAAASGEALGKVFDCLQVERVSRGFIFGLLLQALRVVTH